MFNSISPIYCSTVIHLDFCKIFHSKYSKYSGNLQAFYSSLENNKFLGKAAQSYLIKYWFSIKIYI